MSKKYFGYYDAVDTIMEKLKSAGCRQVEHGMIQHYALDKINVAPYGYVVPGTVTADMRASEFNFDIFVADFVRGQINDEVQVDPKHMHDNLQDVLDSTQYILSSALMSLHKATPINNEGLYVHMEINPTLEPFEERGNKVMAGWLSSPRFKITQHLAKC